jgi:hypothetical protein
VGPKLWAIRLVAAVAGTVAVLTAYLVCGELFADEQGRASRLALLAAAVATGVYSLLAFSRLGLRIVTLVTLEGLAVALWWRAGRDGRLRWWALAGLVLGLAQYTYVPARLLPMVVGCPTLVWIVRRPRGRLQLIRGTALALLVSLLVTAPLIAFFIRYPAYVTLRAEAIADGTSEQGVSVMLGNLIRVPLGIVARGDPNPILNLPGRPLLDVVQAGFLLIGVMLCLRKVRRIEASFLLLWAALMHVPSVVSGVAPTFGRSIGGVLPLVIIVAMGIEAAWSTVAGRWPRYRPVAHLAVLGVLVFGIALTCRGYFAVWAEWPDLPSIFGEQMASVGRYIGGLPRETVVYITPSQKYFATLLLAMGERDRPRDFYGPAGLLPAGSPGREIVYLILEGDETTAGRLEATFPAGRWERQGGTFDAFCVPAAADRARPQHVVEAEFDGLIRLIGADLSSAEVEPGDTLTVRLVWQAVASTEERYTAFVHLLGPENPTRDSPLWAQDDHEPGQATYATDRWFEGEVILDTFQLQIPSDSPEGSYTLSTGFYSLETMDRLPRSDTAGDSVALATIALTGQLQ